jgi:hypothetical protein
MWKASEIAYKPFVSRREKEALQNQMRKILACSV